MKMLVILALSHRLNYRKTFYGCHLQNQPTDKSAKFAEYPKEFFENN